MINQYGGGACSLCGSGGTNKTTCPLNPKATNKPNPAKHPLAAKVKPQMTTPDTFKRPIQPQQVKPVPAPILPVPAPILPVPVPVQPSQPAPKTGRPLPPSLMRGAVQPVQPVQPVPKTGRPLPPSLLHGVSQVKGAVAGRTGTGKRRTAKEKATIEKIFNHFYPVWATYHKDRGQDYKGLFIGNDSSAEARGFAEFIYDTCSDDPESLHFWLGATKKDMLDEMYEHQGAYFRNFKLKLN